VAAAVRCLRASVAGVAVVAAGYCWWAAGTRPFTGLSYLAVGIPVVGELLLVSKAPQAEAPDQGATWPWILPLAAGVSLEAAGLLLGGRDATVPTLSTVVDQALSLQAVRAVLFLGWLVVGWWITGRRLATKRASL
jgi:hypothetical protein